MSSSCGKLYLVRHGESAWNVQRRIQGNSSANPLSEIGRKQAALLGKRIEAVRFRTVHCSDVQRAVETAEIALDSRYPVEFTEELREVSFGSWEGKLIEEIKEECPGKIERWFEKPTSVSIEGGESINAFRDRVVRVLAGIAETAGSENALVITHGGVICSYLTHILGMALDDLWSFSLANASVTIINLEYRPRLRLFGDTSHLDGRALGFDGMPSVYDLE